MKTLTSFFAIFALFAVFAVPAGAQTKPAPRPAPRGPSVPRWDLSVGTGFFSGSGLSDRNANLRGRSNEPFQLFATSSRLGASVPLEVRLGYRMNSRYTLEMRGSWSRPELETSVSSDLEGAPAVTVAENVDLYALDVGLVMSFNRSRQARALTPFLAAGAGYVGAVHEGLTLLENGFNIRGGGGVRYPFAVRNQKRIKTLGVLLDGALNVLSGGLVRGSGPTPQIVASGALYMTY